MEFLKKHYEKIALSLALLGLAGTAIWVFMAIGQKQAEVEVQVAQSGKSKPFAEINMEPYQTALEKSRKSTSLDLSSPHALFNPNTWKQKSDGSLTKLQSSNPADAIVVQKISPLSLIINFERMAGTGFYFGITREAAARPADRRKAQRFLNINGKTDLFTLKNVEGSADNPERFILELNDSKQEVVITPAQPFKNVEGYAADLNYPVTNKSFSDQRINNVITIDGENYKIIAINENEVRVQAISNQKQTTIKWKPVP